MSSLKPWRSKFLKYFWRHHREKVIQGDEVVAGRAVRFSKRLEIINFKKKVQKLCRQWAISSDAGVGQKITSALLPKVEPSADKRGTGARLSRAF